ncbi:MAG: hypothetical protein HQL72_02295 [Magnetococcales bacterium]|nr:hypothetical protein [Magnetococcales bacterium]
MAFKLVTEKNYCHQVTVHIPQGNGTKKINFTASFNYISQSRLEAFTGIDDGDLLDEVLDGWSNFLDADGDTIEYTQENRAQLLDTPYLRVALVESFYDSLSGKSNRRKN